MSVITELINFGNLSYKARDDMEDIFSSYLKVHKFDIEQLRDTRIRAHFGERYDHRRNLVDWDYSMSLKDFAPLVHQKEFREWRLTGVGFETRLATGTIPNRTLASEVNGKTKKGRDSCTVRGFWGDIINSPFLAYGMEVSDPEARMRFFKKVNYQ
mgnify:CR=1 FL=1